MLADLVVLLAQSLVAERSGGGGAGAKIEKRLDNTHSRDLRF